MASQSTSAAPPWSDLPLELLGRIFSCCHKPPDRASFRAVCSSWHSAVRHHCPRMPLPPWVVLPDGSFLTLADGDRHLPSAVLAHGLFVKPSDVGPHRLTLPNNNTCVVGSTNDWLALGHCKSSSDCRRGTFLLHNPFSNRTVPLLDAKAPLADEFRVRKVLMCSRADDDIMAVFLSFSRNYPFVLTLPGKGTWTPESHTPPFMYIVDVAFLGDKLYGITKAEDLFAFELALNDDQVPAVTDCKRFIRHPLDNYGDYVPWSDVDDEDDQEDDDIDEAPPLGGEEDHSSEAEEKEEEVSSESEYSSDSSYEVDSENEELMRSQVPTIVDCWFDDNDESPQIEIITIRYLVESHGKLIMVRRQLRVPYGLPRYTRKVEVFEPNMDAGTWVPVAGGLGDGGQALFISKRFSKSVSACSYRQGKLDDDAIYFMDTGEVFNMRSGTISPALWCLDFLDPTWVFPPDLN